MLIQTSTLGTVNMFAGIDNGFDSLTEEQRQKLAELFALRVEYYEHLRVLYGLRLQQLNNPSEAAEQQALGYSSTVIAPIRTKMTEIGVELAKQAVDIDRAKAMLPMALMALSQSVNLPLLLTSLNIEPDMIDDLSKKLKEYFESGM